MDNLLNFKILKKLHGEWFHGKLRKEIVSSWRYDDQLQHEQVINAAFFTFMCRELH